MLNVGEDGLSIWLVMASSFSSVVMVQFYFMSDHFVVLTLSKTERLGTLKAMASAFIRYNKFKI